VIYNDFKNCLIKGMKGQRQEEIKVNPLDEVMNKFKAATG